MTATTVALPLAHGLAARRALRFARIRGAIFIVIGLLSFWAAAGAMSVQANFSFWIDHQGGQKADFQTSVGALWIVAALAAVVYGGLQFQRGAAFRWRPWLLLPFVPYTAVILAALLDGRAANLTGEFNGTLELAAPLTLGALAGMLCERSGIFNIALEGKMLIGACAAALVASWLFHGVGLDPVVCLLAGVVVAMLSGVAVALLLGWLAIRWKVDQIIAGTVINIGAVGITNFLFLRILSRDDALNAPPTIGTMRLPLLTDIPVLGPILFDSKPYVYVALILVIAFTYLIFRTRWGLRLRASGEKPAAAGTVGINVIAIRYRALILAGLITGLAGSYLSLSTAGSFQMEMTAGKGFIALAAMIFGGWHPIGALGAALVFGFADSTQSLLSILGVPLPQQVLNSVPYIVTIVVVAGVVGRVRGPAESGRPYEQG